MAPLLSVEDLKLLSMQIESICTDLEILEYENAHVSKRLKKKVDRFTIFHKSQSEIGERVISLHSREPLYGQFKVHLIRKSIFGIHLDFEIGDASVKNVKAIKAEIAKLQTKVHEQAMKKLAGIRDQIGTSKWMGLYIYRGGINSGNSYFRNYEEAVSQNIASPEFIQSMKEWKLHFRDVNYY